MYLTGKKILLISPQSWHKVRVSKHHYATTLSDLGNEVYFLNPPSDSAKGIEIKESNYPGVKVVDYKLFFPLFLRFKFKAIFKFLMSFQIRKILRKINTDFDLVWCFDPNLYTDLNAFKARVKIFHPVDVFSHDEALQVAKSADVIFSVSPSILNAFGSAGKPLYHINHGLGKAFISMAEQMPSEMKYSGRREIGYIGNLQIPYLNKRLLEDVILAKPDIDFHFIGPFQSGHSSLSDGKQVSDQFVDFLKSQANVILHGPVGSSELPELMQNLDGFLICYSGNIPGYDLSNTHKMLEYLSTGKPIISTPIQAYLDHQDIIAMPSGIDEQEYPSFFIDALSKLADMDSISDQLKRKTLALENTYDKQVERIDKIIRNMKT
jgi:glycosyltransferase involved in cell wall biosynthesis